jgi:hypothetical protein
VRFERHAAVAPEELDTPEERDLVISGVLCRQVPAGDSWYVRSAPGALEWVLDSDDGRTFLRLLAATGAVRLPIGERREA